MSNRNKGLIITGVALLIVALIVFLVGGYLAGWDFKAWFVSNQAIWVYVLVGIYILVVGIIFMFDYIKKL